MRIRAELLLIHCTLCYGLTLKVSSPSRPVTARERAQTDVTQVTAHIARSYMSSARLLSEGSSSQSQFVIPSARELSEDEPGKCQSA